MRRNHKTWSTSAHRGFVDGELHENTLGAFYNAFLHGADMFETDARKASDGVYVCNHDSTVTGVNDQGETVTYTVAETPSAVICSLILSQGEKWGIQRVPTLEQALDLAYQTGMELNLDLKDGLAAAQDVAHMALKHGMRGRVVYALNGSGMAGIRTILAIDPDARFVDKVRNFTAEKLAEFPERRTRCYAYTADMSEANLAIVRESGCMLELISLDENNFAAAMAHHPDNCEFLHTSDFARIEAEYLEKSTLWTTEG